MMYSADPFEVAPSLVNNIPLTYSDPDHVVQYGMVEGVMGDRVEGWGGGDVRLVEGIGVDGRGEVADVGSSLESVRFESVYPVGGTLDSGVGQWQSPIQSYTSPHLLFDTQPQPQRTPPLPIESQPPAETDTITTTVTEAPAAPCTTTTSTATTITNKKTRKRTGCYTCRRRKKACDEAQPFCSHCQRLDIPCIYPKLGQKRANPGLFNGGKGKEKTAKTKGTSGDVEENVAEADDDEDDGAMVGESEVGFEVMLDKRIERGTGVGMDVEIGMRNTDVSSLEEDVGNALASSSGRRPSSDLGWGLMKVRKEGSGLVCGIGTNDHHISGKGRKRSRVEEDGEDTVVRKPGSTPFLTTKDLPKPTDSISASVPTNPGNPVHTPRLKQSHPSSASPRHPTRIHASRRSPALRPGGIDMSLFVPPTFGSEGGIGGLGLAHEVYDAALGRSLDLMQEQDMATSIPETSLGHGHFVDHDHARSISQSPSTYPIIPVDTPSPASSSQLALFHQHPITNEESIMTSFFTSMRNPPEGFHPSPIDQGDLGSHDTTTGTASIGSALVLSPFSRQWLNLSPAGSEAGGQAGVSSMMALSPGNQWTSGGAQGSQVNGAGWTSTGVGTVEADEDVLEINRFPEYGMHEWQDSFSAVPPSIPRSFVPGGSIQDRLSSPSGNILGASLPSWTWPHVPALIDYFVNGFGPIISVLGIVSKDAFIQSLLPVACESPLLLPALIGWSASHLAPIGEPYASIAKLATSVTEKRASALVQSGMGSDASASTQDKIWIMMMLGGIGICQGNVKVWNESLPRIRNLLGHLMRSRQPRCAFTDGELAMALSCIYYDISASLATTRDPGVPLEIYDVFIRQSISRPEVHMGVAAPLFKILAEITVLAEQASIQTELEDADERFENLAHTLETARSLSHRIDLMEIHSRTLSSIIAWRQDEQSFDGQHLITSFGIFKLAAQAYLRQTVYRSAASTLDAQYSLTKMMAAIKQLLHTPSQSQMLFPLFLVGCDAVRPEDREWVKVTFQKLHTRTGTGNIQTVFTLLLSVWDKNNGGLTWVDWREVADGLESAVSFA